LLFECYFGKGLNATRKSFSCSQGALPHGVNHEKPIDFFDKRAEIIYIPIRNDFNYIQKLAAVSPSLGFPASIFQLEMTLNGLEEGTY
jgi:hypothetical protein